MENKERYYRHNNYVADRQDDSYFEATVDSCINRLNQKEFKMQELLKDLWRKRTQIDELTNKLQTMQNVIFDNNQTAYIINEFEQLKQFCITCADNWRNSNNDRMLIAGACYAFKNVCYQIDVMIRHLKGENKDD